MEPDIKNATIEDTFQLIFKNGALANLKNLAVKLNISEDKLSEVVDKSVKLLSIIKNVDTKTITLETRNKERYILDADTL